MVTSPAWGFARVCVICMTLLILQLLTATSYDVSLDGEAGALVGVGIASLLLELKRSA